MARLEQDYKRDIANLKSQINNLHSSVSSAQEMMRKNQGLPPEVRTQVQRLEDQQAEI